MPAERVRNFCAEQARRSEATSTCELGQARAERAGFEPAVHLLWPPHSAGPRGPALAILLRTHVLGAVQPLASRRRTRSSRVVWAFFRSNGIRKRDSGDVPPVVYGCHQHVLERTRASDRKMAPGANGYPCAAVLGTLYWTADVSRSRSVRRDLETLGLTRKDKSRWRQVCHESWVKT